jgi:hypothetical protein
VLVPTVRHRAVNDIATISDAGRERDDFIRHRSERAPANDKASLKRLIAMSNLQPRRKTMRNGHHPGIDTLLLDRRNLSSPTNVDSDF